MIDISKIIHTGEFQTVEFKEAYSPSLLKTVCAFANCHDGILAIGIDDSGRVTGLPDLAAMRLTITNAINDNIDPRPHYLCSGQRVDDQDVLVIQVWQGDSTPYYYQGKSYIRTDTASVPADRIKLNQLILAGQNIGYEELPARQQELSFQILQSAMQRQMEIHKLTPDLFRTLKLLVNGRYTNTAALLSDYNPVPGASLALLAFDGQPFDLADRQILENRSLISQLDSCMDFYHKHLRTAEIIEGMYRQTVEEVPITAYREAMINAIIHRDYQAPGQIKVEIFPDRIQVISPGSLPPGLTESEYIDGRLSVFRNPILADIFQRIGLAERLATGIRRIRHAYCSQLLQPDFIISANAITIILPRIRRRQDYDIPQASGLDLGESQAEYESGETNSQLTRPAGHTDQIIAYLRKHSSINRIQAEKIIGLGKTQTYKILKRMESTGELYRIGEGRMSRYHLVER